MKKIRIPQNPKNFNEWFIKNYGIGGFENYDCKQIQAVSEVMNTILAKCGLVEMYFLGKVLIQLSDKGNAYINQIEDISVL